jgi:hypothetical protein
MWTADDIGIELEDDLTDAPVATARIITRAGALLVMAEVELQGRELRLDRLDMHGETPRPNEPRNAPPETNLDLDAIIVKEQQGRTLVPQPPPHVKGFADLEQRVLPQEGAASPWRLLPRDFPNLGGAAYLCAWWAPGLWEPINFLLLQQARERAGCEAVHPPGWMPARINGRKSHTIIDTAANLVAAWVQVATFSIGTGCRTCCPRSGPVVASCLRRRRLHR